MPIQTNYFKIGVFVLISCSLLVVGIIAFGLSTSLKPKLQCETYFNRSVQGLSAGSAVKFRGFKVGQVTSIALSKISDRGGKQLVRVSFYIDPSTLVGEAAYPEEEAKEFILQESRSGLRVFLSLQGVTGVGFLDLDYVPDVKNDDFAREVGINHDTVYIPNTPSQIMEIGEAVTQIVKSLRDVDFAGISKDIKELLLRTDTLIASFQDENMAGSTVEALAEIQNAASQIALLAENLDSAFGGDSARALSAELTKTMAQLRVTLKRTDQLLSAPQSNLPATMENLRAMSENLRELSELAKKYPSQLIFGQGPQEVKPNAKNR